MVGGHSLFLKQNKDIFEPQRTEEENGTSGNESDLLRETRFVWPHKRFKMFLFADWHKPYKVLSVVVGREKNGSKKKSRPGLVRGDVRPNPP